MRTLAYTSTSYNAHSRVHQYVIQCAPSRAPVRYKRAPSRAPVRRAVRALACTSTSYNARRRVHQYVIQCAPSRAPVRRAVRADDQPVQREAVHLRLVLVRLPGADNDRQLAALAVPVALLARSRPVPAGHVQYLRKQLRAFDATQREAGILAKFAENYLRRDGMFIVRLIGMNMGEVDEQWRGG